MRKNKEILKFKHESNLSTRQIAASLNLFHSTVGALLRRAQATGLSWPLPAALDDAALQAKLYPGNPVPARSRPEPDMEWVHRELRRRSVTLQLLWAEYKQTHPDGYQYTQFCARYHRWAGKLDFVLRQPHRAGEKLFLDYAGQTVPVVDPLTGEIHNAQHFCRSAGCQQLHLQGGSLQPVGFLTSSRLLTKILLPLKVPIGLVRKTDDYIYTYRY